jgi:hypothetical protein
MKKIMVLVMVVGSFWVGLVWADMERVSVVVVNEQEQNLNSSDSN